MDLVEYHIYTDVLYKCPIFNTTIEIVQLNTFFTFAEPPQPPLFELHAPKTIGHILGSVPIYPASTILLAIMVLQIMRGNQLGQTDGRTDGRTDGKYELLSCSRARS